MNEQARSWKRQSNSRFAVALGLAGLLLIGLAGLPSTAIAADPGADAGTAQQTTLEIAKGTKKVLTVPGMTRVAVADLEIADILPTGNDHLEIIGRKAGTTTLLVWGKSGERTAYTIEVTK